jgi:hypothetical protein
MAGVIHIDIVSQHHPFSPLGHQANARLVHATHWLGRFLPPPKGQACNRGIELLSLASPSGNAFCQCSECRFQTVILKRLLEGLLAH